MTAPSCSVIVTVISSGLACLQNVHERLTDGPVDELLDGVVEATDIARHRRVSVGLAGGVSRHQAQGCLQAGSCRIAGRSSNISRRVRSVATPRSVSITSCDAPRRSVHPRHTDGLHPAPSAPMAPGTRGIVPLVTNIWEILAAPLPVPPGRVRRPRATRGRIWPTRSRRAPPSRTGSTYHVGVDGMRERARPLPAGTSRSPRPPREGAARRLRVSHIRPRVARGRRTRPGGPRSPAATTSQMFETSGTIPRVPRAMGAKGAGCKPSVCLGRPRAPGSVTRCDGD